MMPRVLVLGLLGLSLALSGCGSLRVKVDVLDSAVVETELDRVLIRQSLPPVLAQSDKALHERFSALQDEHFALINRVATEYKTEAARLTGKDQQGLLDIADGLKRNFSVTRGPFYTSEEAVILALNKRIRELNNQLLVAATLQQPTIQAEMVVALRERQLRLEDIDRIVHEDTDALLKRFGRELPLLADPSTPAGMAVKQSAEAVADARKSLIAGQGIVESQFAYVVAGAPENRWSPRFNETVGSGWFGNLNIAVKMVSLGDFTIKGVTFDPSDVARAVSKVTMQALVLAAQMNGVPIKPPTGGGQTTTDGTALAASSGQVADAQAAAALRDAKLQDYRSALLTIGLAIVREQAKLAGTDAERKAAIDAINATYDAHKARLDLTSLQGGTK